MGNTVLITGTSTGIGASCAQRMASEGWTVYAGVRREEDGDRLKESIQGDVRPVLLDVTDGADIGAVVATLTDDLRERGLDGLVNNAGVGRGGPIEALTDSDWRWVFDVNVFGLVEVTRAALPLLRAGRGRVVNIGSTAGRVAAAMLGPYAASKHAVEAITEALRFEVEGFGMRVACVEPGEVETAIWDKVDQDLTEFDQRFSAELVNRYAVQVDMAHGFVAEGAAKGIPASKVAHAVHHALTSEKPKHRYLVGPDAKVLAVVASMPDRLRHRLLALNIARWSRSGRKLRAGA